jgi:AraC family transcriptional regulator of adaptative response/methylated-DNA-[protein]-cysteine methyltransferase
MLYQSLINTPLGSMIAIADETALCLLEFPDRVKLDRQLKGLTPQSHEKVKPLLSIEKELALYFSGELTHFETPVKLIGTPFQQSVWRALQRIPFGETRSYAQISNDIKKPMGYRAVANANGANRLAIIIPCHDHERQRSIS